MKKVVVTGLSALTPLGANLNLSWQKLIDGQSGVTSIESGLRNFNKEEYKDIPSRVVAALDYGPSQEGLFDPLQYISKKDQRRVSDFIIYAIAASQMALDDANYHPNTFADPHRCGVIFGSGIGGLDSIDRTSIQLKNFGFKKVSPFFIPSSLINLAAGHISIKHGFKGPSHALSTACSTGAHALGDAARIIALGQADMMIAGASESSLIPLGFAGFCALKALSSRYNDCPQNASRPWDKNRDGFVMGEGAGCMILEEYEHAKARGAKIYAYLTGYGTSSDASHITAPSPDGEGAFYAMKNALDHGKISCDQVNYINAHGTSTPMGDAVEAMAIKRLFGQDTSLMVSSTKSSIGHLLGASGAVESVFSVMAMNNGIVPPTLNLFDPCDEVKGIDLVPFKARESCLDVVMNNSFGFGGMNVSLIFQKTEPS